MSIRVADLETSTRSTNIALIAVWIVAGGTILTNLIQLTVTTTGRFIFFFWEPDTRMPITALPQVLRADLAAGTDGYLSDAPGWLRALCATPTAANTLTVLLAAILVAGIIRKIAHGQPFNQKVIRNWKLLSFVLIIGGTLEGVLDTVAGQSLMGINGHADEDGAFELGAQYLILIINSPQWPILLMLLGVFSAALAIAFRSGARLESEVDGVV